MKLQLKRNAHLIKVSVEPVSTATLAVLAITELTNCIYLIRLMNIYKDSAESEAQRALSVITDLRAKIGELLLEWPEHPGLKQVIYYIWSCLAAPFL